MTYRERLKQTIMQDTFARQYVHLARAFMTYGPRGERALREAIRLFARMRGESLQRIHLDAGLKLNLHNLFTYGDMPGDPRTRRNQIRLNSQERLSETLICAIYDNWREMDAVGLGRIYCEEFHHAKWSAYAPKSQTNLTQTLTQEGDDYCRFSVYLRPANMDDAERSLSFDETNGPGPEPVDYPTPSHRAGYAMLTLRMLHAAALTMRTEFGHEGIERLGRAVTDFATDLSALLRQRADSVDLPYDREFMREHCPIPFPDDPVWEQWHDITSAETGPLLKQHFWAQLL